MPLAKTRSAAITGVVADIIDVEVNIGPGLPGMHIVGLGDTAVHQARDRIKTAIANEQLPWPKTKIIANLSPAALPKHGTGFDLALCLATLAAASPSIDISQCLILGEVGLDGAIKGVPGVLPALVAAKEAGLATIIVPAANAQEAALLEHPGVLTVSTLSEAYQWMLGHVCLQTPQRVLTSPPSNTAPDMADVVGQQQAREAMEIAAAGAHHMMMVGPPGSGKSMIASRLPGLLPPLSEQEAIEVSAIYSVTGNAVLPIVQPQFVAPHHSVSMAALIGGGHSVIRPGAASLAHCGVLFLDEVSEIPAPILDSLRTPLESGEVVVLRQRRQVTFPARFQLIMAANPCRCGAEQASDCRCSAAMRRGYLHNVSGPLRDRLDVVVNTHTVGALVQQQGESSAAIRQRVLAARERSLARFGCPNAAMNSQVLRREYPADEAAMALLSSYLSEGMISQRGVDRALKVSWTLADLAGVDVPNLDHMAQALELKGVAHEQV